MVWSWDWQNKDEAICIENISPGVEFGIQCSQGRLVSNVKLNSLADERGVKTGWQVQSVGGLLCTTNEQATSAFRTMEEGSAPYEVLFVKLLDGHPNHTADVSKGPTSWQTIRHSVLARSADHPEMEDEM